MKTANFLPALAIGLTSAITVGIAAPEAQAGTIYSLGNHPDGSIADPGYGLRMDNLLEDGDKYTFDFDNALSSMTMVFDEVAGTINILGDAYGGADFNARKGLGADSDGYKDGTTGVASFDFDYTGLTTGSSSYEAVAGGGSTGTGSMSFMGIDFDLRAKADGGGNSFYFATDHRGFAGLSGWGWLEARVDNGDGTYGDWIELGNGEYQDWLFTAEKVPEPTMTLGLLAVGGLLVSRRKRNSEV
ncbi:MAG: PEP-CTERM sorting domain-containing protein [Cyanobacteria bacterium P01_C01_bin.89]